VVYASSSSALATGSALTFDGTNLSVGAAGSSSTWGKFVSVDGNYPGVVFNSTAASGRKFSVGVDATQWLVRDETAGATRYLIDSSGNSTWSVGGTRTMDLTSTGLGIGTSSPAYKVDVAGIGRLTTAVNSNATSLILNNSNTAAGGCGVSIDGYSGNTSNKLAQIVFGGAGPTGGNIDFLTSANGSSYVQQMRLDTAGNLGLAETSPSAYGGFVTKYAGIGLHANSTSGASGLNLYEGGTGRFSLRTLNGSAGLSFYDSFNGAERARIDSSGNLLIGTTTNAGTLTVLKSVSNDNLVYFGNTNTTAGTSFGLKIAAGTNGSDYAFGIDNAAATVALLRVLGNGNLLVGTTSGSGNRLDVVGGGIQVTASGTSFNLLNIKDSVDQSGATYVQFYNSAGGGIGNINRVTTTNAVVYNTTSDYRLKTVTGVVTGQGARIDALKPIDYLWKDGGQQARGFLAHEFQTIYPNSVTGDKDAVDANGNPKYQAMQAGTSEVIADLIAEIQSLRQRLSAANL
jgi:hypothetical protein